MSYILCHLCCILLGGDPKERLAKQKRLLQKKLGLDVGLIGMETDDLFNDEDLKTVPQEPSSSNLLKPPVSDG